MKGIKKTLMAGVLACATFNGHAEVSPFGYGVKIGPSISSAVRYGDDVKMGTKKADGSFIDNFWGFGGIYGEYAFMDYVGVELGANYMKQGASLTAEQGETKEGTSDSAAPSIRISSHGIAIPFYVSFYPLGREQEEGIFKVSVGAAAYIPFQTTYASNGTTFTLDNSQKKEESKYDIAGTGRVEYEFPFGFSVGASYSHGLISRFKRENNNKDQAIFTNAAGLKDLYVHTATLQLGYNFASLLSE